LGLIEDRSRAYAESFGCIGYRAVISAIDLERRAYFEERSERIKTRVLGVNPSGMIERGCHVVDSIPSKVFSSDVVFVDAGSKKHFPHVRNQGGRNILSSHDDHL